MPSLTAGTLDQVNELKIELQIADDAQKSLGTTVRKSKKVTEALRDRLLEETSKIQQAEETLAESKAKHAQHSESQQRLIDAMQASLDATERTRTIEAHRLEDLSHMKTIEALVEWSIAELERSYFRRQKELEDVQEQCVGPSAARIATSSTALPPPRCAFVQRVVAPPLPGI